MAREPHEGLAAEAAAYLAGSGDVLPLSRGDASELRKQSAKLCQWAQAAGRLNDYTPPAGAPQTRGAEHEVFFHERERRVFKRTHPGTFGSVLTERGLRRTATPYFYLRRLELINQVFDSDIHLEAVTTGDNVSIVISQPWAYPADPKNPLPTSKEIFDFMTSLGFEPVNDAPFDWFRRADKLRVSDARPDNFIKSTDGVVPIDLIITEQH